MTPLIEIRDVERIFRAGDETVTALSGIDLTIDTGEMVAIVGASGSGKSTLMNILGCLDRPTSGNYRIAGRDVSHLTTDELAALRRGHFGFIFQRYHLLGALNAIENAAMPAIYAGMDPASRRNRAGAILNRLGLGDRLDHRPNQLSGGQQQRVSIARALMNGGNIILADEPTGALDSRSGETVLDILRELHAEGHTIIIVTHDMKVAAHAGRIIEVRDGRILSDRRIRETPPRSDSAMPVTISGGGGIAGVCRRLSDAFPMALRSMASHRMRTLLTMLGIVIGIAAVIAVTGLGEGSRQKVLSEISELGASTLSIYPGKDWGDERAASITTLVVDDARALEAQSYVDSITPEVSTSSRLRIGDRTINANISGVGPDYFRVTGRKLREGTAFSQDAAFGRRQEAVIDEKAVAALFRNGEKPIGQIVMIDRLPVKIVGVVARRGGDGGAGDRSLQVYLPFRTLTDRLLGPRTSLAGLTVRISDGVDTAMAESAITDLMTRRHGAKDFFVFNSDQMRRTIESTSRILTLLISLVAVISLVVGGIGVMNIMLVSVTERTREIGLRMSVGARRIDILLQFLIEAMTVCIAGSLVGVTVSLAAAATMSWLGSDFPMIVSGTAVASACLVAALIGLVFGFLPARNASRLDPVEALSRE